MMRHDELLVRTLKLRSSDDTMLLQARYRLEEAFRTAALPDLLPNAQVLIRHLDLGSIRTDLSAVALAGRISGMMRDLAAEAVCIDRESHPNANVVWFSDPLQPYVTLVLYLLEGKGPTAWYWRSLFPARALAATSATMEWLLPDLLLTPLKGLALSHLLRQVIEARRLPQLLPLISEALVIRLIYALGLSPVAVSSFTATPATEMIAAPRLGQAWRDALSQTASTWGAVNLHTRWLAWQALLLQQPERITHHDSLQCIDVAGWLQAWAEDVPQAAVDADGFTGPDQILPDSSFTKGGEVAMDLNEADSNAGAGVCLGNEKEPPLNSSHYQPVSGGDLDDALHAQAKSNPFKPVRTKSPLGLPGDNLAPFSIHAGFAFVIPLLQRLSMNELLQTNEALIELDLPRQLLWTMANRLRLAHDDPAWAIFETFHPYSDTLIERVQIPLSWRCLTTASGRPLASCEIISLTQLFDAMQLLAGVYLRRYCHMSLRGLIKRPGRVFITPTHWDVSFEINDTDLRLRRVALDANPGWVAWLGRVVQFHYDSQGEHRV